MELSTKKYRLAQFEKIKEEYVEYKTKVKFIKPNGETHWIDIDNDEFAKIKDVLVGAK